MERKSIWTETFPVRTDDVNHLGRMTPSAILRLMQEAAWHHAQTLDFGYDSLKSSGLFWVLSRLEARFDHFPVWRDEVGVETWPSGISRLFATRDFRISDADGVACEATSSWIILEIDGRKPIRPEKIMSPDGKFPFGDLIFGRAAGKVDFEERAMADHDGAEPTHRVRVSDLDNQGHVNNAKYLEWCLDEFDPAFFAAHTLTEATMNFLAESHFGEVVSLQTARPTSGEGRPRIVQIVRKAPDSPVFAVDGLWVER